jgi:hypothetical protein
MWGLIHLASFHNEPQDIEEISFSKGLRAAGWDQFINARF